MSISTPRLLDQDAHPDSMKLRVYRSLKADIVGGIFDMGERLNEGQLASKYGVSKTPVREALTLLQREGLVEVLPRVGYLTSRVTLKEVQDIFDLREILEGAAAERAASSISEDALRHLDNLDLTYRPGDQQSYRAFLEQNLDFHRTIAEASGNERLVEVLLPLLEHTQRLLILRASLSGDGEEMVEWHRQIVDALRRRDPASSRDLMVRSIANARQGVIQSLMKRMATWHI